MADKIAKIDALLRATLTGVEAEAKRAEMAGRRTRPPVDRHSSGLRPLGVVGGVPPMPSNRLTEKIV